MQDTTAKRSQVSSHFPYPTPSLCSGLILMKMKHKYPFECFQNPNPSQDYLIKLSIPEFTCLCPLSGQPDFARLLIWYIPHNLCIELKKLKIYMWSFRDKKAFHEAVSNEIFNNLYKSIKPRFLSLKMNFNVRGGIYTSIFLHRQRKNLARKDKSELLQSLMKASTNQEHQESEKA